MPKKLYDEDGLPTLMPVMEAPQLRDGYGRSQISTNPNIVGAAPANLSDPAVYNPSLETFRRGISHWSRFNSIYRQVVRLKERFPTRTAPELLTGLLLNMRNVAFMEQLAVLGGKLRMGGGVIDIFIPASGLALGIHGRYYHTEDVRTEWLGLIGQNVNGMRINEYRYIFDDTLYRHDNGLALDWTLAGMQLN